MATIKAVQIHAYGGPDVLIYEETSHPAPKPNEVLIHVYAAGLNPVDWKTREGLYKDFGEGLRTSGIGHFCFRVEDVDAVLAELDQRGVPTFVELGSYPDAGVRLCFVKDNNGNLIEFVTPLKD